MPFSLDHLILVHSSLFRRFLSAVLALWQRWCGGVGLMNQIVFVVIQVSSVKVQLQKKGKKAKMFLTLFPAGCNGCSSTKEERHQDMRIVGSLDGRH